MLVDVCRRLHVQLAPDGLLGKGLHGIHRTILGKHLAICRGIVTADVLELGLSRGAIATRKLEGVKRDKEYEGLYWFGPLR